MKKTVSLLCLASSVALLGVVSTNKAEAATIKKNSNLTTVVINRPNLKNTSVSENLKSELRHLSTKLTRNLCLNHELDPEWMLPNNDGLTTPWNFEDKPFAKVNDDMELQDGEALAANTSSFSNYTGVDQTMSTPSFSYTQTDTVTTATTNSIGIGLKAESKLTIPFFEEIKIELNAKYDYSSTNTVQTSVTKKWEVPSQNIKVPAGHKYKVNWVLKTGKATGTTDLTSQVKAVVPMAINPENGTRHGYAVGYAISEQKRLVDLMPEMPYKWAEGVNWTKVDSDTALRKWGTANYTAEFGTEMDMTIIDVTNGNSVVKRIPLKITPKIIRKS